MAKSSKTKIPTEPTEIAKRIDPSPVHEEMRDSFMPYALSVTTARAIPDVRDGLKPVQRRILYAMNALGLRPGEPFRKSAAVVGEVMGKYHPHGDSAIYEAMVRMGQSFAMSFTLVDPKGNFGSLDDPPAAYRYTEARLTAGAMTLVDEIDEDTVEFVPNFDGERQEPTCLPAVLPNLLVNGASGIAVGMATSMAPHNLGEVAAAIGLMVKRQKPKPTVDDLMKHLPAPDFPNGGRIVVDDGLRAAYETGRGSVRVRARAEVESATAKRYRIVVTELPYMVGPERVMTKIRELIQAGKLPGVASVEDLSDRHSGLRLVIECRSGVGGWGVLSDLYRLTPLEDNFSINNVALVDDVPTTLGLYDLCKHYIDHRLEVIKRRTLYRLDRATERCHIVEGLLKALEQIDLVIAIIRGAANVDTARAELIKQLKISEIQANHILDLQLRRLTALEVSKLEAELAELLAAIADYKKLLDSKPQQRKLVGKELDELAEQFPQERRTELIPLSDIESFEKLAKDDRSAAKAGAGISDGANGGAGGAGSTGSNATGGAATASGDTIDAASAGTVIVTLSTSGLLSRAELDDPKTAKPGRHDLIATSLETSVLDVVYAVTDAGRLLSVDAGSIPEMVRGSRGASVTEMFSLKRAEKVVGLLSGADAITPEQAPVALVTRSGQIKRVDRAALSSRRRVSSLIKLADDDKLVAAFSAPDGVDLVMLASDGQALRTATNTVAIRQHSAGSILGMKLKPGAVVVMAGLAEFGSHAVLITNCGAIKATDLSDLKSFGRGTGGTLAIKLRGDKAALTQAGLGAEPESSVSTAWIGRLESLAVFAESVDEPGGAATQPMKLDIAATEPRQTAMDLQTSAVMGLLDVDSPSAHSPDGSLRTATAMGVTAVGEYRFK